MLSNQIFLSVSHKNSHLVSVLRPCPRSVQYCASKKASYEGVMVIEIPFVLICVSATLLYLCIVMRHSKYNKLRSLSYGVRLAIIKSKKHRETRDSKS